jgi:MFS family permease
MGPTMRSLYNRYAEFFRLRGVVRFAAFGFVARMPLGTVNLATLLHVRELTGSIAFAGSVVGAQMIAAAASAPVQGRVIDVRGPQVVLAATGILMPLAMLAILFAGDLGLRPWGIAAAAVLAGSCTPPVTVIVRTVWRHRFDDEASRRMAFAFDGTLLEVAYTVGPVLIAVAVAIATTQVAMAVAWLCAAAAVPMLSISGGLAWWQRQPPAARRLLGPLHDRRLVAVYVATFFLTMPSAASKSAIPVSRRRWEARPGDPSSSPSSRSVALSEVSCMAGCTCAPPSSGSCPCWWRCWLRHSSPTCS